jgi:hypothetical protein
MNKEGDQVHLLSLTHACMRDRHTHMPQFNCPEQGNSVTHLSKEPKEVMLHVARTCVRGMASHLVCLHVLRTVTGKQM